MSSRRRFLKFGAASIGSLALRNFGLIPALASGVSDYKALVCIFLFGGNDSNNTIIPADPTTFSYYTTHRASLALSNTNGVDLTPEIGASNGQSYYFHSGLKELAALFQNGNLSIAANVGPLVQTTTKAGISAGTTPIPAHLFSHSDQQYEWQTSDPTELAQPFGWGGRAADQVDSAVMNNMVNGKYFPTFLSVAGGDLFGTGQNPQLEINPGGNLNLSGYNYTTPTNVNKAFSNLVSTESGLSLVNTANGIMSDSQTFGQELAKALAGVTVTGFPVPATSIGAQLQQVAQLISVRETLGMQRQIFFLSLGGFDTHYSELESHKTLYPQLSAAMNDFFTFLTNAGLENNVVTFTESDFSRTFAPTTTDGSDHAWGSHHMIMSGGKGGFGGNAIYNSFPDFDLGGSNDFDTVNPRGRWIPTAAIDQYGASLVNWLGLSGGTQVFSASSVFPNLGNFTNPNPFTFFG